MREEETHGFAGTTFLLSGVFLLILAFPREIALLVLLLLAFADPLAGFVGVRYGRTKLIGSKSLEGSAAAFLICFIVHLFYLSAALALSGFFLVSVSLLGALIAASSELISFRGLDDNLSFPLLCGAGCLWSWQFLGLIG